MDDRAFWQLQGDKDDLGLPLRVEGKERGRGSGIGWTRNTSHSHPLML